MNLRCCLSTSFCIFAVTAFAPFLCVAGEGPGMGVASIYFVANEGQWDGDFAFRLDAGSTTFFATPTGMMIDLHHVSPSARRGASPEAPGHTELRRGDSGESPPRTVNGHALRMNFVGANLIHWQGQEKLFHYSNYFLGRDSCKWRSRVSHYRKLTATNVWPGIDVELVADQKGTETIYHVHPGADPSMIRLRYEGQDDPITVDANGRVRLQTSLGAVTEDAPFAYQVSQNVQQPIPCRYVLTADGTCGLALGPYDPTQELVIDPLVYASYWGGCPDDEVDAICADRQGHKIIAGHTWGVNFPITPGVYRTTGGGGYVSKFTVDGDTLLFSTFAASGGANSIACDANDAIYVADLYGGHNLPVTPDAFDTTLGGEEDGCLIRYSSDGTTLEFCSYLGGSLSDDIYSMALDSLGDVYLCGFTESTDFPVTPDAIFPEFSGRDNAYVCVFHPATSTLTHSTYFPGQSINPVARISVVSPGRVWIGGETDFGGLPVTANAFQHEQHGPSDGFIAELDFQSNSLVYCSYLGGTSTDTVDGGGEWVRDVFPLQGDTIMICGTTDTPDFPVTPDAYDTTHATNGRMYGFLTVLALPQTLVHSTMIRWTSWNEFAIDDHASVIAVSEIGFGELLPLTPDAYDTARSLIGLVRLSPDLGHLDYGTYFGGETYFALNVYDMLLERNARVWFVGDTQADTYPITPNALVPQHQDTMSWMGYVACLAIPGDTSSSPVTHATPLPKEMSLTAFPNPFNPSTTLTFTLPSAARVVLEVTDVLGRQVYRKDFGTLTAGEHRQVFETSLPSGSYFASVRAGSLQKQTKLIIIR